MNSATTTIHRAAFSTLGEALAFAQGEVDGTCGGSIQILVGSTRWPDPKRRFRVTVAMDHDTGGKR
jgi:hypothetical protein